MSEEKTLEKIAEELKEIQEELKEIRKEVRGLRMNMKMLIKVVKPLQYFYGGIWGALLWTITVIILFGLAFTAMGKSMPWIQGFGLGLGTGLIAAVLAIIWAIITIKTSTSPSRDNKNAEEEESD